MVKMIYVVFISRHKNAGGPKQPIFSRQEPRQDKMSLPPPLPQSLY